MYLDDHFFLSLLNELRLTNKKEDLQKNNNNKKKNHETINKFTNKKINELQHKFSLFCELELDE